MPSSIAYWQKEEEYESRRETFREEKGWGSRTYSGQWARYDESMSHVCMECHNEPIILYN